MAVINGSNGNDTLTSLIGADTMSGLLGADKLPFHNSQKWLQDLERAFRLTSSEGEMTALICWNHWSDRWRA